MKRQYTREWRQANHRYLEARLRLVQRHLERFIAANKGGQDTFDESDIYQKLQEANEDLLAPPALDLLCKAFELSEFERDVLLLCAGAQLDATFAHRMAEAQGDSDSSRPNFSLALAVLPEPSWDAFSPEAALRFWKLIVLDNEQGFTLSPLRVDERILNYLLGVRHHDERLVGLYGPPFEKRPLPPSHQSLAGRMAGTWREVPEEEPWPVLQLCGQEHDAKRAIVGEVCKELGLNLWALPATTLPTSPAELETWTRLLRREARLTRSVLLLDCDDLEGQEPEREAAMRRLVAEYGELLVLSGRQRRRMPLVTLLTFEVAKLPLDEQHALWQAALGDDAAALNGQIDRLVFQFHLDAPAIRAAVAGARGSLTEGQDGPEALAAALWDTCRSQARPRLDDLATSIRPAAGWDDLVLPPYQLGALREIVLQMRQRATVYDRWGFAAKGSRGLGISALFAGSSGTGKTMAAEVLARELHLDLYRIDLSAVVSKYIGETEKNLQRVFDAAEEGGAVLLFDEADALFGKRSEVKDSHDRHANIEVSYLLQRMESYSGLAILTSNLKESLDQAFLRRLRFVIPFAFPDAAQRALIWARIFPHDTPTQGLDPRKLALLNVAGGNIRNIALNAAFLAAEDGSPVTMAHMLQAARHEYAKLDRTLTEAETRGWV